MTSWSWHHASELTCPSHSCCTHTACTSYTMPLSHCIYCPSCHNSVTTSRTHGHAVTTPVCWGMHSKWTMHCPRLHPRSLIAPYFNIATAWNALPSEILQHPPHHRGTQILKTKVYDYLRTGYWLWATDTLRQCTLVPTCLYSWCTMQVRFCYHAW